MAKSLSQLHPHLSWWGDLSKYLKQVPNLYKEEPMLQVD
jgi:hypothetical protein